MTLKEKTMPAAEFKAKCLRIFDEHEIIAATSVVEQIPLLTRDKTLLKSKMVPFVR